MRSRGVDWMTSVVESRLRGELRDRERHPWLISCASGRPSHFSLSGQREVTKRKATPEPRPLDIPVQRVRESGPRFVDGTSMCRRQTRALPVRDPAGFPSPPHRVSRAPLESARSGAQKQDQEQPSSALRAPSPPMEERKSRKRARVALLCSLSRSWERVGVRGALDLGSRIPCEAAVGWWKSAQGRAHGWARVCRRDMDVPSTNHANPTRTRSEAKGAPPGSPSLWLLSLGDTRESDSDAAGGRNRAAPLTSEREARSRSSWIPAFAGITRPSVVGNASVPA